MAIKVKKKSGKVVNYPVTEIKKIFKTVGFTGGLLVKATKNVFNEVKRLAKSGVVTVTDLEKAIVKAVNNTNKIAMNTAQKVTRKILK